MTSTPRVVAGRATLGIRGGLDLDPELPFLGAHAQIGPIVKGLWFRPSYEFGFGEVTKINSFNFDFPDLTLRGRSRDRADFWNVYFGAGGLCTYRTAISRKRT